jgi:hypothetical protein
MNSLKLLITALVVLSIILGCSSDKPTQADQQPGLKKVSIDNAVLTRNRLSLVSKIRMAARQIQDESTSVTSSGSVLSKAQVVPTIDEAKVFSVNMGLEYYYELLMSSLTSPCDFELMVFDAFHGKDVFEWNDLTNAYNALPFWSVIDRQDLEVKGRTVSGEIGVKEGLNYVFVGLIQGGRVTYLGEMSYLDYEVPEGVSQGEQMTGWTYDSYYGSEVTDTPYVYWDKNTEMFHTDYQTRQDVLDACRVYDSLLQLNKVKLD